MIREKNHSQVHNLIFSCTPNYQANLRFFEKSIESLNPEVDKGSQQECCLCTFTLNGTQLANWLLLFRASGYCYCAVFALVTASLENVWRGRTLLVWSHSLSHIAVPDNWSFRRNNLTFETTRYRWRLGEWLGSLQWSPARHMLSRLTVVDRRLTIALLSCKHHLSMF